MKESTLWDHLRPGLERVGKFQKISDRFTPGVPDVLGCHRSLAVAMELKELDGVTLWKTKFRPGQLDWLRDHEAAGGLSLIVSSHHRTVYAHPWRFGAALAGGVPPSVVANSAIVTFLKTRQNSWRDLTGALVDLMIQTQQSPRPVKDGGSRLRKRLTA